MSSHLAELLDRYGHKVYLNSPNKNFFDATLVLGLWHLNKGNVGKRTIAYACGSDVWDTPGLVEQIPFLKKCGLALYGHPEMAIRTGVAGFYWQLPVDTKKFFAASCQELETNPLLRWFDKRDPPERDCLFYAPNPITYCLNRIWEYVEAHPKEKCTLISRAAVDFLDCDIPENLLVVRWVPYSLMNVMYHQHKAFRKWLSHKATPVGKMECEAKLAGLRAYLNDKEIEQVPSNMLDYNAMPKLENYLNVVAL